MTIVFICGSLEPGRDGVGDYTRRLAAGLLRQHHRAVIIAFADCQPGEQALEEVQSADEQAVHTIRLSSSLSLTERSGRASAFINGINPDWISLQYVPFSFHDKGLPIGLPGALRQLIGGKPLHIMFHELWVGMSKQSSKRHILWGQAQRYLIRSLVTTLRPQFIHTHTPLYQVELGKLGLHAAILPLFSNIARLDTAPDATSAQPVSNSNRIAFVLFGGIAPEAPVDAFAEELAQYAVNHDIAVSLTIVGRSGPEQETWVAAWRSHGLAVDLLGEQGAERISQALLQSTMGLATTPAALSGKSGSIAALHAHGLPVLCVSAPWQPRNMSSLRPAPGIAEYRAGNLDEILKDRANMRLPTVSVTDAANTLIDTLSVVPECSIVTQTT